MAGSAVPATRRWASTAMFVVCCAFAIGIVGLLGLVTAYLVSIGGANLSWDLFTKLPTGDVQTPGGLKHAIVGTLVLLGLASVIGVPLGILTGIYLSEYSHETWLSRPVRFVADILSGVPSIVVGILGYELVVVPLSRLDIVKGFNGWAGAFALAFIMIPIVARTSEEMLRLVPQSYRAGSLALGASKSQTILRVILPAATGSVLTGVMLAVARVAGETAPLLFTAANSRFLTMNPNEPFPSLTVQVYEYATGPYDAQKRLAWAGMLVLIGLLFIINVSVRAIAARTIRGRLK